MPERENPRSPIAQHLTRDVEHQVRPPHYRSPLSPTPSSRCSSGRLCPTLLQLRLPPTPTHMGGQARGCAGSLAMERASPRHAPRESSGYHNHCTGRAGPESLPGVRLRPQAARRDAEGTTCRPPTCRRARTFSPPLRSIPISISKTGLEACPVLLLDGVSGRIAGDKREMRGRGGRTDARIEGGRAGMASGGARPMCYLRLWSMWSGDGYSVARGPISQRRRGLGLPRSRCTGPRMRRSPIAGDRGGGGRRCLWP
jgi:hypothetical protein